MMKSFRTGLLLLGFLTVGAGTFRVNAGSVMESLPNDQVRDDAGFLSPDARERVRARLNQFYSAGAPRGSAHRANDVQLYVYTVRNSGRSGPDRFLQDLYRSWRSVEKEQGTYVEREVILFVFQAERQARVISGKEIPPGIQEALKAVEPDLPSLFAGQPEEALLAVIDRLAALAGVPATYHDPPPVPADPGPLFGTIRPGEGDRDALVRAVEEASRRAGNNVVLVMNPELNFFPPRQRAEQLAAAWPGRTLLLICEYPVNSTNVVVVLRPDDRLSGRFSKSEIDRLEREVVEAANGKELGRTLVRALGEIGALSAGQPLSTWSPWRHPLEALTGGRDASSDARFVGTVNGLFKLAFLIAGLVWLWFFIHDPREATVGLLYFLLSAFLGGGGGSGGGGSSGFSGGGGSSGGGGASGSW